uniref:Charged multivesicular body protein 4b n=1 Tax=Macrostomum lignano TaxID=282301 RepID=A0A1I8HR17_9PLAT
LLLRTMSFLFGKKKEKSESPQEAIQRLRNTEEMLNKKSQFLEKKIHEEITQAKKHGTKNKRAALQALARKKRYEKQLTQIDGTLTTIEFQREALENASTNTEVLKAMQVAAKSLKSAHQDLNIDQEISDAISSPAGFGHDVDEDDLLAELEELEQEDLDKQLLDVGGTSVPELPSAPRGQPEAAAAKKPAGAKSEEDEMRELEAWAT